MEIEKLANIEITDEDILWVEEMMGGKVHFDSARVNVLKNMDSVDIQAFPGSGKTTILVAKLAILAKKWPYSNAGICVLSHTNVAREEMKAIRKHRDWAKIVIVSAFYRYSAFFF
ncbi:MAG: UvrD-helicase domain-containing protein [Coprococcus sp.]